MTQVPSQSASPSSQPAWTDPLLENPHAVSDKATRVNKMFSAIAPSYDLNNRLHSLWMDQHWRNVAVKMAAVKPTDTLVDVACGTGDLTLKFARAWAKAGGYGAETGSVCGIDFTYAMLPIARKKSDRVPVPGVRARGPKYFGDRVHFMQGDAMALPLPDASADVVSIAFGIRNVSDWGKAIDEFHRVLRPGGRLIILEFSLPKNAVLRGMYNFYFRKIMPRTATLISGDRSGAYKYLPESVNTFITREAMQSRMQAAGFADVVARPLTFGICVCYRGVKREGGCHMLSPDRVRRHIVKCEWKCKHCREIIGSENINHYGASLPDLIKPTWFFASMALLDHLRDCRKKDYSAELAAKYGTDFLNHESIYNWFNIHATVERHYVAEEDLD